MVALKDPKHEKFAQGIAKGLRHSIAYREAGYKADYRKADTSSIIKRPHIQARVIELIAAAASLAEISIERVLREMALIAFANVTDFVGDDGEPVAVTALTRDQMAAVSEITCVEVIKDGVVVGRKTKYKLLDKRSALVDLGSHLGLVAPDVAINNAVIVSQHGVGAVELERILLGIVRARTAEDVQLPPPLIIDTVDPAPEPVKLRLVTVPVESATTTAYFEWLNKPPRPPGSN